ncbi:Ribosomal small subunit pseudouridine synthase A [hydrothermal vent metagenome]|uniref:Ribosomal small subunit pseudouridine synthase A n=1 Tax=hydrothermal vent metagenome TaxID=652676 RepID=A0A3B0W1R1_9ZZZZ
MHVDRFLCKQANYSRKTVLQLLSQRQIKVDGQTILNRDCPVTQFSHIEVQGKTIQRHSARYYMLNKPEGILSATTDAVHTTALELLTHIDTADLHIAGRLDRATTGLLIITNDGQWSRKLTALKSTEEQQIPKVYLIETAYPISPITAQRFMEGIYFKTENFTTSPAELELISETTSRLTIYEGRYHQVKRMFAAVGNRVAKLHREKVGGIVLDSKLKSGEFRSLTPNEISWLSLES